MTARPAAGERIRTGLQAVLMTGADVQPRHHITGRACPVTADSLAPGALAAVLADFFGRPGGGPVGHLTTSEHPGLLAAAIRDIAARHGGAPPLPVGNTRREGKPSP